MQLGELKLSPVPALLLGAILGCVVTSVIHSLTISCVQCGSASSRNLVGFDKSSLTSNNHFRVRQIGLVASDSSCATLRLQLETVKSATPSSVSTSSYKRRRRSDDGETVGTSNASIHAFLNPVPPAVEPAQLGKVRYVQEEYQTRKGLLVGVVTAEKYLATRAKTLYETWGKEMTKLVFFVASDCKVPAELQAELPIIKLEGVSDQTYPPQRKVFLMVKYMHDHFIDDYDWFMRADDDVYIRSAAFEELLGKLDPQQKIYLGRAGMGKPEDLKRLQLLPHEKYCMGGPGVVFSQAALKVLAPQLEMCLSAIILHNKQSESPWYNEDVELGRCASRVVDIQCSVSQELRDYLQFDYKGVALDPNALWSSKPLSHAITVHPVKNPDNMRSVHHYYKTIQLMEAKEKLLQAEREVRDACVKVIPKLSPPGMVISNASCHVHSHSCRPMAPASLCEGAVSSDHLPAIYKPSGKFDLPVWKHFDYRFVHQEDPSNPRLPVGGEFQQELSEVTAFATKVILDKRKNSKLKFDKIVNGFVRHDGPQGRNYILDLLFTDTSTDPYKAIHERVTMVRPMAATFLVLPEKSNSYATINFIVPLFQVSDRLGEFLVQYEHTVLQRKENARLLLSVYGSGEDIKSVQAEVNKYTGKWPNARIIVLKGDNNFTRARAIHKGMDYLKDSDLVFICDVDLTIRSDFFTRCRKNAIQGSRVYYPEFFKLYNLDYVYRYSKKPNYIRVSRENGHWATYSFGMVCLYKSDYVASGGFDLEIEGWGGEDVDLFLKVLKSSREVMRVPDVGLTHRWHPKICNKSLPPVQLEQCLSSQAENLADRVELARYLLELEDQLGALSKTISANIESRSRTHNSIK